MAGDMQSFSARPLTEVRYKRWQIFCRVFPGYSEDGGAQKGEVIPEHEFAEGPICLDDENEFPPVSNQSN